MRVWTILTLAAAVAFAESSTNSSGDYAMDLGQVYGAIRATKMLEEVCTKDFPATREGNQRAYEQWRRQYLPFAQEIERHFSAMALREAKDDSKQHMAVLAKIEKGFDGYKDGLRKQMASEGPDIYRKQCEGYPTYLRSPRMNLESYYGEQVATIRRGPK